MRFFVTCARGTEGPLRRELADLRIRGPRGAEGGVSFEGTLEQGMAACLHSRVAMRVLLELSEHPLPADDASRLYEGVRSIDWAAHLTTHSSFAISATVGDNPALAHSGFAALKAKDAIVDKLRDQIGGRPDVNVEDPDVPISLHIRAAEARIYLDLAGAPLHRRGYRVAMTEAPLKENLAAAILALADADPARPLLDPMAGSGTFVIEQALRARQIAPGLRRRFAFERWPDQEHIPAWGTLKREAEERQLPEAPAPIFARDISPDAVAALRRNAAAAGVDEDIRCQVAGLTQLTPPTTDGTLITNPPYGERLSGAEPGPPGARSQAGGGRGPSDHQGRPPRPGTPRGGFGPSGSFGRERGLDAPTGRYGRDRGLEASPGRFGRDGGNAPRFPSGNRGGDRPPLDADAASLEPLYETMSDAFARFAGWQIGVISGNPLFSRVYLRRPDITHRLYNGPLETRLLVYRPAR